MFKSTKIFWKHRCAGGGTGKNSARGNSEVDLRDGCEEEDRGVPGLQREPGCFISSTEIHASVSGPTCVGAVETSLLNPELPPFAE